MFMEFLPPKGLDPTIDDSGKPIERAG